MAKHEPWFKPRDEDGDERLLEGFRRPQPQPKSGGCARIAAPVVAVVVALLLAVLL